VSLPLLLWMMPVILGLLLSIPIAILSSSVNPNRRSRLFQTPEQTAPPAVLARANELASASHTPVGCPLRELGSNGGLLEAHLSNLPGERPRKRGEIDPHLAIARAKIEDAETVEEAAEYLSQRETFAVLCSPAVLTTLFELPLSREVPVAPSE
jgi:membrane glycosyltransferase